MHELSIMDSALTMALEQARQAGASRVHALRLRVGAVSGVVADSLRFAFDALAEGTPAEGAQLIIETVPARFWCPTCQNEFEPADFRPRCPVCGKSSDELRAGRELEVASLEID